MKKNWTGERLETFVYNGTMVEHLHRYSIVTPIIKGKIILDIACGEGYGSNLMAQKAEQVFSVDIDLETIERARVKYPVNNITFKQGSADRIPIPSATVDVVVSFETLEHHDKHIEMMEEIKRVLKPGGILIMSSPVKKMEKSSNPFHIKELTTAEFTSLIQKYFINTAFYDQRIVFGSLIVPQSHQQCEVPFEQHGGDYKQLNSTPFLIDSTYNLCIASDRILENPFAPSFFDGDEVLREQLLSPYKSSRLRKWGELFQKAFTR